MPPPKASRDTSPAAAATADDASLVDVTQRQVASNSAARTPARERPSFPTAQCPEYFGSGTPCPACITAAGDPAPGQFVLGPGVEEIRRCGCGQVYGAYQAGRQLCFLMEAPGRRQVYSCIRCGVKLTRASTSSCTPGALEGVDPRDTSREASRRAA